MSLSVVLEVALGLAFMYLLLALICTAINEMIAGYLNLRARTLIQGLKGILNSPGGQDIFDRISEHPMIKTAAALSGPKGPSYLSAHAFTTAILDVIASQSRSSGGQLASQPTGVQAWPAATPQVPQAMVEGIAAIGDPLVRGTLEALLREAQGDFEKFKQGIAAWFDDAMDRLSGVYKRNIQRMLLGLSLGLAVAFNADTISVATTLWRDAPLRAEIAAAAGPETLARLEVDYPDLRGRLQRFPVGWTEPIGTYNWYLKPLGLLITAIAVSLGAPFWFDVLGRVNAIRSAGPKPPRGLPANPDRRGE
ncbi:MAG: hypothetical protein L0210_13175 [Rhodospirillales bacterium]|nr:hypothetical protein [Rhodospirillales bacterium]